MLSGSPGNWKWDLVQTRMELVAAAWTRLHFQPFAQSRNNCTRLVHAFY